MCDVCCADMALDETRKGSFAAFLYPEANRRGVEVQAEGKGAEGEPARYRLRRRGVARWSPWFKTRDLAGVMGRLGLDVGWDRVPSEVRRWVTGGPREPALDVARGKRRGTRSGTPRIACA